MVEEVTGDHLSIGVVLPKKEAITLVTSNMMSPIRIGTKIFWK